MCPPWHTNWSVWGSSPRTWVKHPARPDCAAQAIRAAVQINRLPDEQEEFNQVLAYLAKGMGESARDAAMAKGAEMSVDEAVTFALGEA